MEPTTPEGSHSHHFSVERVDYDDGRSALRFAGELTFLEARAVWEDARELLQSAPGQDLVFDLSEVTRVDGGTTALLSRLRIDAEASGARIEVRGARGSVAEILALYDVAPQPSLRSPPGREPMLEQIGRVTWGLLVETKLVLDFLGRMLVSIAAGLRRPRTVNWGDVLVIGERAGADGLGIVVLINFLVGFIMAFQSAAQLKQFGANILVADLVGLVVCRELGPLMTAIIVAGRSGASFAAELGTMKVSEEIDALHTLGFDPLRFLVVPRMIALMLVLPILALLADLVGIVGGLLVGITTLDLTVVSYVSESQKALDLWDVFSGLLKTVVFAAAIAFIACQQGLATSGGAQGVGRRTTSSVVSILFALILIDAGFAMLFYLFGV